MMRHSEKTTTHVPQLQLTLDIGSRDPAPFEDALFELGALSVTLEDAAAGDPHGWLSDGQHGAL